MEEEYHQGSVDTDAVSEQVSQSPVPLLQSAPLSATTPLSQLPRPPLLSQPTEATVTFPSSCNTTASLSSSYISQGVDLTALAAGDLSTGGFGTQMAHKCVKCSESFSTPYELAIHWQEEHRDSYKCKRCERCFAKKHNLLRHNCVNACNICGQQFTRRYNLKLHMQIHGEGSKMYKCEYCGKSFTRRYTLLTHTRSHSGIKLFKCSICGKAFTRQHTLNLHLKRHVTKASFFCRKCYAVFTDAVSLQLHRETEHPKASKGQATQGSTASQSIPSSSNVVFPNSNPGYVYGTEKVGVSHSYHVGPYFHQGPQDTANQLQGTFHGDSGPSHPSHEEGGFENSRETNLMPETSGRGHSLDKPHWFEDEGPTTGRRSSARHPDNLNQTTLERESALKASGADVVTVVDSADEAVEEEPMFPDQSTDVKQETMSCDGSVVQDLETKDGKMTASQDFEPVEETRRSLFPIDNSKKDKRTVRNMHRLARSGWRHGDKLVKETSEVRIDVVDPNSLEESNPLLTPPRSSDTSTPRLNQASSESGSPNTASFLEMSPSYSNQANPSVGKISQSLLSSTSEDKACQQSRGILRVTGHEVTKQASPCITASFSHGNQPHTSPSQGNNGNSDSSFSEMASRRSLLQVSHQAAKHSTEAPNDGPNWRCIHCGITFEESLMYVVHMGCHGQLDPFQCSMCGVVCPDRMAFTLHIIGGKHIKAKP